MDGFEWACFECAHLVYRVEVPKFGALDEDLPPLFAAFDADEAARTCPNCGAIHPGAEGPIVSPTVTPAVDSSTASELDEADPLGPPAGRV
ncbi:MAG: hypothetical protein CM1200mP26_06660 [Acidimicrobiales bacterium]|nr:MAG: hypothetical protein CM1200mP26_06660 [Acidimicrobiales bacterium]